jgi:hypothetical protein
MRIENTNIPLKEVKILLHMTQFSVYRAVVLAPDNTVDLGLAFANRHTSSVNPLL